MKRVLPILLGLCLSTPAWAASVSSSGGSGLSTGATSFPASPYTGQVVVITDDSTVGACDSAAGSAVSLCRWNGSAWLKLGDGTAAGGALSSTDIDTCAELAAIMTGETGTCGSLVLSNSPTLVTPNLGTPSALVGTNITGTAASLTAGTATVANSGDSATSFFSSGTIEDARLPSSMADKVITGSFQVPNGAAPTTDAFGEIAGDNNAWAASRGAVQFYDGTANTYLLGVLASDTPSNGECPKWNTGGTITWETCSGGGSGDVTAASAFGTDNVLLKSDGTGKGTQATGISVADTTNIISGSDAITFGSNPGDAGRVRLSNGSGEGLCFEIATPGTDKCLILNTSDQLDFNGTINLSGSTTGSMQVNGATSGSLKVTTADATAQAITVTGAAQTTGATTLTIPDQGGTNRNFVFDTLTQTLTNKTLTAPVISTISNTGTVTLPTATDTLVARATTDTLTNKTLDCTSAGNVCTITKTIDLPLVGVSGGTAGHVWDDAPTLTACTPGSAAGTNQTVAYCTFPDSDGDYGRAIPLHLPASFVAGSVTFIVDWKTTGTGNARFRIRTICYATDEAGDSAYSNSSYVTAAAGTSGRWNKSASTSVTTTGCAASETMWVQFERNRTEASDTLNAALDVRKVVLAWQEAQ